jgi:hypothetical protein
MINHERVEEFAHRATKVFQLFGFQWGGIARHCPTFSEVVDTIHDLSESAERNWYVCTTNMEPDNYFQTTSSTGRLVVVVEGYVGKMPNLRMYFDLNTY